MKKVCELGRSMVEMLGVLAIIGVLSVGGIAGYSKAMEKYKLNKQATQLTHLANVMHIYKNQWEILGQNSEFVNLIPYYKSMGEIDDEMIKDESEYIYDSFGSKIKMSTNGCIAPNPCTGTVLHLYVAEDTSFSVCQNFFQIGKEFDEQLSYMGAYKSVDGQGSGYRFYGSKRCNSQVTCIKDTTLIDMEQACRFCEQNASMCTLVYSYSF